MHHTLADLLNVRMVLDVACRSCPHHATVDPRELAVLFAHKGWSNELTEVRRRLSCSACASKHLSVKPVRPPRDDRPPAGPDGFVFVDFYGKRGEVRGSYEEAFEDAIDAKAGEYRYGKPFITVPASIEHVRL